MRPETVKPPEAQPSHGSHRARLAAIARRTLAQRGFAADFSADALRELARVAQTPPPPADAEDLRGLAWCSIDNDDSRDLDQLTVAEELPNGEGRVLVAVADVDGLVGRGSALDDHARQNTTSLYTSGGVFPMLPERLSTDLTSLGPGVDRTAIVTELFVGKDGTTRDGKLRRAVVHNRAKLAYHSVAAFLEGTGPLPEAARAAPGMDAQLRLQDRLAQAMKAERRRNGALDLASLETRPRFQGETLVGLDQDEHDRAHVLIEELMVAANGTCARYFASCGVPSLRRVVRTPKRWDRIVEIAREQGESLPPEPSSAALERFLAKRHAQDPLRFPELSLSVVKALGRGEYVVEAPGEPPIGHFGLAVRDYTHSTAPNRRFPDLVTHRMLKALFEGARAPYGRAELEGLARHCTEREAEADKVERQLRKSAAALLLEGRTGERFDALVTGASPAGTWVRCLTPPVEGRLVAGHEKLDIGHRLLVRLVSVDVDRGFIDFERV
ncbi:MAG: RNB domain-containing ribonuclease [Deltaproteobacteria bacterium]